ncbi:hypothetical protein BDW66DRAFT_128259 [Aspergillus desertorum]
MILLCNRSRTASAFSGQVTQTPRRPLRLLGTSSMSAATNLQALDVTAWLSARFVI